ncbi:site-2 protease family protein [Adhaeribacter sp. BT258]|uniref:Site-2 protease family protein n=1 Tax=Adhaeribacter terrigena TaxID=2793070 RepID=A0ABS1C5K3_9BACT|nr:site-2 protease family protein [Adhaeribacter terrigena]MBK0404642.1 site-2 protease family protein [Adhaeribacter terrigena]
MPFKKAGQYSLHLFLFLLTLFTTTLAGGEWATGKLFFFNREGFISTGTFSAADWRLGLMFSLSFLGVLTVHEFGHYFTARFYKIRVTLPYYIPMFFFITSSIGTMGAFIKIKDRIFSRKEFFDVGVAGPLAGLAVALPLLFYGYTHLPDPEYIFRIHPEYQQFGLDYAQHVYQNSEGQLYLGKNLLILFFENFVADPNLLPPKYELIHYPFLLAGYLSLIFTALNLLPVGQLDGGHVLYGLLGYERFNRVAPVIFVLFIGYAGLGIITPQTDWSDPYSLRLLYILYLPLVFQKIVPRFSQALTLAFGVLVFQFAFSFVFPNAEGYHGWLVFGLILSRALGVHHPPCPDERPLSAGRKVLGWLALLFFVLCFSPTPFVVE